MTDTASGTTGKARKRKPKPLLPPEEAEKAPPPVLTRREKVFKFIADRSPKIRVKGPFATPEITVDNVDEFTEIKRFDRALKRLTRLAALIAFLGVSLAVGAPFFAPLYVFHSITPEGKTAILVPLDLPNLTNPAVVSWAATSVTEILSFGFGDVEAKTVLQKKRFTPLGWKAFVKAFLSSKVSETFKRNQMVMTTVPSDTPVILSQGVNDDDVFQWKVDVPIITTYAANNDVIKPELGTIQMTIVRVPYDQSPSGIAIDIWRQIKH
jgi:hypothetical protein